jgi:hypothetical protein
MFGHCTCAWDLSHRCVSGTGFGIPDVVPLVWKNRAMSSGVTSGRAGRGEEGAGRLARSGMTSEGVEKSVTRLVKSESKINVFPPVFFCKSRMIGVDIFALRTSGTNPARMMPYRCARSEYLTPVILHSSARLRMCYPMRRRQIVPDANDIVLCETFIGELLSPIRRATFEIVLKRLVRN